MHIGTWATPDNDRSVRAGQVVSEPLFGATAVDGRAFDYQRQRRPALGACTAGQDVALLVHPRGSRGDRVIDECRDGQRRYVEDLTQFGGVISEVEADAHPPPPYEGLHLAVRLQRF